MSFTICPNCQRGFTCVGQLLFCPACKYRFEVKREDSARVKITREIKKKKQPVWNSELQKMEY